MITVPLVEARLSAGTGSMEVSSERGGDAFRSDFLHRKGNLKRMVLMRVSGDSMEPEIFDNDLVLLDQGQKEITPGRLYAVGFEDAIYNQADRQAAGAGHPAQRQSGLPARNPGPARRLRRPVPGHRSGALVRPRIQIGQPTVWPPLPAPARTVPDVPLLSGAVHFFAAGSGAAACGIYRPTPAGADIPRHTGGQRSGEPRG